MNSEDAGPLTRVASWIEYPFTTDSFPWKTFAIGGAIIVLIIFFMHDGLRVISETVGERV